MNGGGEIIVKVVVSGLEVFDLIVAVGNSDANEFVLCCCEDLLRSWAREVRVEL